VNIFRMMLLVVISFMPLLFPGLPDAAFCADLFYDISVRGIYDDNVVGLLSDKSGGRTGTTPVSGSGAPIVSAMGPAGSGGPGNTQSPYTGSSSTKNSDTAADVFADLGGSFRTGKTSWILAGSAELISYSTFSDFNMTAGWLTAAVETRLAEAVSARITLSSAIKRFGDVQRNSSAHGGSLVLKERLGRLFWIKQGYGYEKNNADSSFFSYTGNAFSAWAGYMLTPEAALLAGYQYLRRDYEEPVGFRETADTFSLALEWMPIARWFVGFQYDRRMSESNLEEADVASNIFSIGVRYSYD
jgi:hypothetical protein